MIGYPRNGPCYDLLTRPDTVTPREILLYWSTVGFEIPLCLLVYIRNLRCRLPFFTAYVTLMLTGTLGIQLVYHHFGFRSSASYHAYWLTAGAIIIARFFAVVELCQYQLRAYKGVWALAWRVLALLVALFLGHAAVDAWGQLNRILMYGLTIERDFAITSIVILLAMMFVRNYYGFTIAPLEKRIALGLIFVCVMDVVNNTMLRDAFKEDLSFWLFDRYASLWPGMRAQVERANDLWNTIRTSGSIISMSIWCHALRKPLPAPVQDSVLLPAEVYRQLSPAVNICLRTFNDRLLELLKP